MNKNNYFSMFAKFLRQIFIPFIVLNHKHLLQIVLMKKGINEHSKGIGTIFWMNSTDHTSSNAQRIVCILYILMMIDDDRWFIDNVLLSIFNHFRFYVQLIVFFFLSFHCTMFNLIGTELNFIDVGHMTNIHKTRKCLYSMHNEQQKRNKLFLIVKFLLGF